MQVRQSGNQITPELLLHDNEVKAREDIAILADEVCTA